MFAQSNGIGLKVEDNEDVLHIGSSSENSQY
jgi:hypothetical protein